MEVSLTDLVDIIGGEIAGDGSTLIRSAASFDAAGADAVTFADSAKVLKQVPQSNAGAVIVPKNFSPSAVTNLVYSDSPRLAFARALHLFYPRQRPAAGISPRACIGENFQAGTDVSIGAMVAVGNNVRLGDRVCIHPGAFIGENVEIGDDSLIHPNVTILDGCRIGCRNFIQAGTVIGSDGYGFVPDGEQHLKIPQMGIVRIDDDVEIGSLNTIDRATFGETWIKSGVKTDNQVHIGHNVIIGENTLVVAQVGIAGSASIGRNVTLAGQAGLAGHIHIGDKAIVGPRAGVTRSVEPGQVVSGTPEMPHRLWLKVCRVIPRLPDLKKRLDRLEATVKKMAGKDGDADSGM